MLGFRPGLVGRFAVVPPADQDAATFITPTDAILFDELGNLPLGNFHALVERGCVTAVPEVASALARGDRGPFSSVQGTVRSLAAGLPRARLPA